MKPNSILLDIKEEKLSLKERMKYYVWDILEIFFPESNENKATIELDPPYPVKK